MKDLTSPESVNEMMKTGRPTAIFFYMTGCPHCERMEPIWNQLENEVKDHEFAKVESAHVPPELGITGFPKFKKGGVTADGEMSKEDLKKKLFGKIPTGKIPTGKSRFGGRRRRSRSTRRRIPLRPKLSPTRKRSGRMIRRI